MCSAPSIVGHDDLPAVYGRYHAVDAGRYQLSAVAGHPFLDARAHGWRLGPQQGHGLALHVGPHQGPVGVIVFQEGDQRRRYAHDLHRRNVHQVGLAWGPLRVLVAHPNFDAVLDELVQVRPGLAFAWAILNSSSLSAESQTIDSFRARRRPLRSSHEGPDLDQGALLADGGWIALITVCPDGHALRLQSRAHFRD